MNNDNNERDNGSRFVDSEDKFCRYLTSSLFGNGVHVWWLICLFAFVTLIATVFTFVAAYIDLNMSLRATLERIDANDKTGLTLVDSERTLTEI